MGIPFSGLLLASSTSYASAIDFTNFDGLVTDHLVSTFGPDEIEAMLSKLPKELTASEQAFILSIADVSSNDLILDAVEAKALEGLLLEAEMRAQENLNLLLAAESAKLGVDLDSEDTTDEDKEKVLAAVSAGLSATSSTETTEILDLLGSKHGNGGEVSSADLGSLLQSYARTHSESIAAVKPAAELYRFSESGEALSSAEIVAKVTDRSASSLASSFDDLGFEARDFDLSQVQKSNGNPLLASLGGIENTLFDSSFDASVYVPEEDIRNSAGGQARTFTRNGETVIFEGASDATEVSDTGTANAHDGSASTSAARSFVPVTQEGVDEGAARGRSSSSSDNGGKSDNAQPLASNSLDSGTSHTDTGSSPEFTGNNFTQNSEKYVPASSTKPEVSKTVQVGENVQNVNSGNEVISSTAPNNGDFNQNLDGTSTGTSFDFNFDPATLENLTPLFSIDEVPEGFRSTYGQLANTTDPVERDRYIIDRWVEAEASFDAPEWSKEVVKDPEDHAQDGRAAAQSPSSPQTLSSSIPAPRQVLSSADLAECNKSILGEVMQLIGESPTFQQYVFPTSSGALDVNGSAVLSSMNLTAETKSLGQTSVERIFNERELAENFCLSLKSPEGISERELYKARAEFSRIIADQATPLLERISGMPGVDSETPTSYDFDAAQLDLEASIAETNKTVQEIGELSLTDNFNGRSGILGFGVDNSSSSDPASLFTQTQPLAGAGNRKIASLDGAHHFFKDQAERYAELAEGAGDERASGVCFDAATSFMLDSLDGSLKPPVGQDWNPFKFKAARIMARNLGRRTDNQYPDLCDSLRTLREQKLSSVSLLEAYLKKNPDPADKLFNAFSLLHYEMLKAYQIALDLPSDCDSADTVVKMNRDLVEKKATQLFTHQNHAKYFKGFSRAINDDESSSRQRLSCLNAVVLDTKAASIVAKTENPDDETAKAMKTLVGNLAKARSGVPFVDTEAPGNVTRAPTSVQHDLAPKEM